MKSLRKIAAVAAIAATGVTGATSPAGAQPVTQERLVNVNLTDLVVQVPIGIAANVCDVNVGVLISDLRDTAATCDATATPDAITTIV